MITIDYILPADDLLRLALKRRFQLSICRLLTSAALGFIAEIDIKNYTEKSFLLQPSSAKSLPTCSKEINGHEPRQTRIRSKYLLQLHPTSSSRASRNLHREPPEIIIAGKPAIKPRNIIVASLAKSSLRAPRNHHCASKLIVDSTIGSHHHRRNHQRTQSSRRQH
jgi:hypothetical protein